MKNVRARFIAVAKHLALLCGAWLLSVTCSVAAPITVGTFGIQYDIFGPAFVVTNDSAFAGQTVTFSDVHLWLDLDDLSTLDFLLADAVAPSGAVDSNGAVDVSGQWPVPDIAHVLDAYLTLTLLDQMTSAVLPGLVSLGPTNPANCFQCTNRMTDFADLSTLAIRFDPAGETPVPEPASLLLLGGGIATFAVKKRWFSR